MSEVALVEAVNMALARAMEDDDKVIVLGEDVGINGGVFRTTVGLQERFGAERVIDTPLAETLIAGMSIGMAAEGLKPVFEIQFMGFIYSIVDQMISHASRLRNRTRGRLTCPLVVPGALRWWNTRTRTPFGKHRGHICPYARIARRHTVITITGIRVITISHCRS